MKRISPLFMPRHPSSTSSQKGMALVMVLLALVLVTVTVVALLSLSGIERSTSGMTLKQSQADLLADAAANQAMGTISNAILQGSQPNKSWASEPGRIWIFDIAQGSGAITKESVDLISALPSADPNNVDLNSPSLRGEFPIAPPEQGNSAAHMKVGWTNILRDPSQPASATNPIIGRVAYWVDDESCKVNINTADGSQRTNATFQSTDEPVSHERIAEMHSTKNYSFGFGTPSEISLAALPGLDQTKAAAIAAYPWNQEYSSTQEITRAKDAGGAQVVTPAMLEALRFDITHHNSSPDLNFMGEPRIALQSIPWRPSGTTSTTAIRTSHLGPYIQSVTQRGESNAGRHIEPPLDSLYPQPTQILKPPYLATASERFFLHTFSMGDTQPFRDHSINTTQTEDGKNYDYYIGKVITSFLSGVNLKGQTFTWPAFNGADSGGFTGKYTNRQLDSITLQILDTVGKISFSDQDAPWNSLTYLSRGWLSNEPVVGVARGLRLNEILMTASTSVGGATIEGIDYTWPILTLRTTIEMAFPAGFKGMPQNRPYDSRIQQLENFNGGLSVPRLLNFYDAPTITKESGKPDRVSGNSQTGTVWMDQMLRTLDQGGEHAGFDLTGNSEAKPDPDQSKAALFHPYLKRPDGQYNGGRAVSNQGDIAAYDFSPALEIPPPIRYESPRAPGMYGARTGRWANMTYLGKGSVAPDTTSSIRIVGGLNQWLRFGGEGGGSLRIFAPFDSVNFVMSGTAINLARVKETVIPVDFTVNVPGQSQTLISLRDPLVFHFPLDWETIQNPNTSERTMPNNVGADSLLQGEDEYYIKGGNSSLDPFFPPAPPVNKPVTNRNGDNFRFRPSGGGDPLSVWLPNQDTRIPKQARFPSVGALFSIRTGLFPDRAVAALPHSQQRGVPFRGLNMAPSTQASQGTEGGTSYPDWAMLDLFHVPFLPQKPFMSTDPATPFRRLTYGGATVGRMNINNPEIPYPFSENIAGVAQTPPRRNALRALFRGLNPSNSYSNEEPVFNEIDAAESTALATAVSDYQRVNGPFLMAGEIANVPAIASYLYTGVAPASRSRNDVVRDTVGAITTRSNTYSVWVIAQTIQKKSSNTDYGEFESGDTITSQVRRRYLVERFIETGRDGVPGNAVTPASSNLPNTQSSGQGDPIDGSNGFHPELPYPLPYRWRVLTVENFQLL